MKSKAECAVLADRLGIAATCVGALLVARRFAPVLGARLAMPWGGLGSEVAVNWGRGFHLAQFTTYLCTLSIVGLAIFAWAAVYRTFVPRHAASIRVAAIALAALVIVGGFAVSWPLGFALIPTLAGATLLLSGGAGRRAPPSPASSEQSALALVLIAEVIAITWGVWLVISPRSGGHLVAPAVFVALFAAAFAAGRWHASHSYSFLAQTFSPVLLLPLLGLFRAPSPGWLLVVLVLAALIARFAPPASEKEAPRRLLPFALGSIAIIAIIPLGFRDLASINYASHEAQHLGWINSALRGRWLGADCSTFYGILREGLLVLFCRITTPTVEHIRIGHLLLNLIGLGALLALANRLIRGRPLLLAFIAYLILFHTPLRSYCDFEFYIAFGWADALRSASAVSAVVVTALVLERRAEHPEDPKYLYLVGCGALAALAMLYSQEFGLCALLTVLITTVAYFIFREKESKIIRLRAAALSLLALVGGMTAIWGGVLAVYGIYGKAGLLVRNTWHTLFMVGSGAFGSLPYPVNAATFIHPIEFFNGFVVGLQSPKHHDGLLEFIIPVGIYFLVACRLMMRATISRLGSRCTPMFALMVLGIAMYRMVLARSTIDQVMNGSAPAILCLGMLIDESMGFRLHTNRQRIPVGAAFAGVLVVCAFLLTERIGGIGYQAKLVATGRKLPPKQTKYVYPDLPRAGDAYIDNDFAALARHVHTHVAPDESILALLWLMDGGELYFLCDRPNATRFDLLAEIITTQQQKEVLQTLQDRPPKLVIGMDGALVGREVIGYVASRWTVRTRIGRYVVYSRP